MSSEPHAALERRVRANSQAVWNEWVGGWRSRERTAYGFAFAAMALALVATIGWWGASHQPLLPPAVITVDRDAQVLDVRRPRELAAPSELELKHDLAQFAADVFSIYDSADVLAADYGRARAFLLPGSQAWLEVQRYWDRYSPLRRYPDGTLRMPTPPKARVTIAVPSFIARGKSADGAEIYDIEWTATPHAFADDRDGEIQKFTGRLEFVRSYDGATSEPALIANPFGIRVRFFKWDRLQ